MPRSYRSHRASQIHWLLPHPVRSPVGSGDWPERGRRPAPACPATGLCSCSSLTQCSLPSSWEPALTPPPTKGVRSQQASFSIPQPPAPPREKGNRDLTPSLPIWNSGPLWAGTFTCPNQMPDIQNRCSNLNNGESQGRPGPGRSRPQSRTKICKCIHPSLAPGLQTVSQF